MPGFRRRHNLPRDPEGRVDLPMPWFRGGALADIQDSTVVGGEHHGDYLMGARLPAQGPPRSVHPVQLFDHSSHFLQA